jgi:hypothetical protein
MQGKQLGHSINIEQPARTTKWYHHMANKKHPNKGKVKKRIKKYLWAKIEFHDGLQGLD